MTAANALPTHPGPLAHARRHIEALLAAGQEVLVHYEHGEARGGARRLQRHDRARRAAAARAAGGARDARRVASTAWWWTSSRTPTRCSSRWCGQSRRPACRRVVVGDLKQAIMGFQGADPRLFEALAEQHPDECKPLTKNWRSQPRIMEFVNALGPKLFGDGVHRARAAANRNRARVRSRWCRSRPRRKRTSTGCGRWRSGERFRALLEDPAQTIDDRHTQADTAAQGRRHRGAVSDARHAGEVRRGAARAGTSGAAAGGRLVRLARGEIACTRSLSREPGGSACGAVSRGHGARVAHAAAGAHAADGCRADRRTRCSRTRSARRRAWRSGPCTRWWRT